MYGYQETDNNSKMGIIGERAVRNALCNYRLMDYIANRENMPENYHQGSGLDARRGLVYYTVYSTRGKPGTGKTEDQGMEIDLIEEWMYADDMKPHKKAHEVKGELASIQGQRGSGKKAEQFRPLVFNYEPNTEDAQRISAARRLHGTGNVFVEVEQGLEKEDVKKIKAELESGAIRENGSGYAYVIRDTAAELERLGFDEGRDVWFAGIVYNNREIGKEAGVELPHNAEPLNDMILLAVPQQYIIEGIGGEFQKHPEYKIAIPENKGRYSCGYCVPFSDIYPIDKAIKYGQANTPTGGIIWGEKCQSGAKGARLYEETGILASFKGIKEEWSDKNGNPDKWADYRIMPICWINPCCAFNIALPTVQQIMEQNRTMLSQ